MQLRRMVRNAARNAGVVRDMTDVHDPKVLLSLLGPAVRGFVLEKGKTGTSTDIPSEFRACFNWEYKHDDPELLRLYGAAKKGQWNGEDLPWEITVDPFNDEVPIILDEMLPIGDLPAFRRLTRKEILVQKHATVAWMLSQFLHGEQGALFAACQVTQAVQWLDAKFYGSTQVVDEGRHVEVFQRYLTGKLNKLYSINDNLYVIIDALMSDSRWDIKFLGMQILIEGLALGAFGTLRLSSREPLLREMLKMVISDEARHVHFGVVAVGRYFKEALSPNERREREDWTFEMAVLLRNRFLAHELYDEYYAHAMSRAEWDREMNKSPYMEAFRRTMFKRIIPNLKRIGLLSPRIRPHYQQLGLLQWENEKAAPDLTAEDLLAGT